ncbi:MAG: alpha/beta hydrolase [Rhodospirillaceae bacterium]
MIEDSLLGLSAAGFHRIAYTERGDPDADRVVVCVHGLTRNGRDFDRLADSLAAEGCRVICPDMVGRGQSDWLAIPELYDYPQYLIDLTALIARLGVMEIDWVGTSMGGLAGMMLAAQPKSPIRRLVINDIGPFVPKAALERIGDYVGTDPVFEDSAALEAYLRFIYQSFGDLPAEAWADMAEHSTRLRPDGRLGLAYDPAIGNVFKNTAKPITDIDLWPIWDSIRCPVLVLHGVDSDLLLPETCREMRQRGPEANIIDIPGTGHAPGLMIEDQIALVRDFLLE